MKSLKRFFTFQANQRFNEWLSNNVHKGNREFYSCLFKQGNSLSNLISLHLRIHTYYQEGIIGILPKEPDEYDTYQEIEADLNKYIDSTRALIRQANMQNWPEYDLSTIRMVIDKNGPDLPYFPQYSKFKYYVRNLGLDFNNRVPDKLEKFRTKVKIAKKRRELRIIYEKSGVFLLRIKKPNGFYTLNLTNWCIKDGHHWRKYVLPGRRQYVVRDFNIGTNNNSHAFSFTKRIGGDILHCYDASNTARGSWNVEKYEIQRSETLRQYLK